MSTDIAELFARDPLSYTKEDRSFIVDFYRNQRKNFELGMKAPARAAKAPKAQLDLDTLEI